MKKLKDFTIKEFYRYQDIISEEQPSVYDLLTLFGYDLEDMSIEEMRNAEITISSDMLETKGVQKVYKVGNRRFKAMLDITKVKAGQFIDLQSHMTDFKIEEVLTVFLIPQYRNKFGIWVDGKYGQNYDIFELKTFLLNNFKISDANELSSFFFQISEKLLTVIQDYSEKKMLKTKYKMLQKQIKEQSV